MSQEREIETELQGRLDEVLAQAANISRAIAQKVIRSGVSVDGKQIDKPSFRLKGGSHTLRFVPLPPPETAVKPNADIQIETVYEDDSLIVFNKPRGLVVHTAPGHSQDTLVNLLVTRGEDFSFDAETMQGGRPGIVHRLDKDTSGLLLVAKTPKALASLQEQIRVHAVRRTYLALTYNEAQEDRFTVDVPLLKPTHEQHRALPSPKGHPAITHFERIWARGGHSLLRCELETGRTHQIRAHLAYIGLPVVGDPLYGTRREPRFDQGQLLHAYRIEFTHPTTGERLTFFARMDACFKAAIEELYTE